MNTGWPFNVIVDESIAGEQKKTPPACAGGAC